MLEPAKIKKINCCNDCGVSMNFPPLVIDYQIKSMDNEFVRVSCDSCINMNHTLTDEELGLVKKGVVN